MPPHLCNCRGFSPPLLLLTDNIITNGGPLCYSWTPSQANTLVTNGGPLYWCWTPSQANTLVTNGGPLCCSWTPSQANTLWVSMLPLHLYLPTKTPTIIDKLHFCGLTGSFPPTNLWDIEETLPDRRGRWKDQSPLHQWFAFSTQLVSVHTSDWECQGRLSWHGSRPLAPSLILQHHISTRVKRTCEDLSYSCSLVYFLFYPTAGTV